MKSVQFTADYQYETGGLGQGPTFKAGHVENFRADIAERFVRRGVAVYVDAALKARAEAPAAEPAASAATAAPTDAAPGASTTTAAPTGRRK